MNISPDFAHATQQRMDRIEEALRLFNSDWSMLNSENKRLKEKVEQLEAQLRVKTKILDEKDVTRIAQSVFSNSIHSKMMLIADATGEAISKVSDRDRAELKALIKAEISAVKTNINDGTARTDVLIRRAHQSLVDFATRIAA